MPNYEWRLYQRDGVFYACGRKHGGGKNSLGTRDRKVAINELFQLDSATAEESNEIVPLANRAVLLTTETQREPISILAGWMLYIEKRSIPIHLGGLKPSSITKYHQHKNRFVPYCLGKGVKNWSMVDRDVLEGYAKVLDTSLAPVTIHDDLTMEISVSNWLIRKKFIAGDCKIDWKLQKPPGAERYCYERDEVSRMLKLAETLKKNRWLYSAILLLSHTGVRIGEAINLKWMDIDLKHDVTHIRDDSFKKKIPAGTERRMVKDKEFRIISIHQALLKHFTKCSAATGYFLTGDRAPKLNYNHSLDVFKKKIIKPLMTEFPTPEGELGFKDGRFHSFRHFFVRGCFDGGIPEYDIKDWVGHSDSKIVKLYRHIRSESAKANMRLGKFGAA